MVNPDTLTDKLVAMLATVPDIMLALGSSAAINGYKDAFPSSGNLRQAILQQPLGSILVVFMGTDRARFPGDRSGAWSFRHKFSFMARAARDAGSYAAIWSAFVNGVPWLGPLPLFRTEIDAACDPMDREGPIAQRNSLLVSLDGETLDYFEFQATLIEKGA